MNDIPRRDADLLLWMRAFADGIASHPSTFALSASDAAAILKAVDEYQEALFIASQRNTRNPGTISRKDTARNGALGLCRIYAQQIKYNNGISNADKIRIGVRPVNPSRQPIHCPQTSPTLTIVAATPGEQMLRYADSLTPNRRAKPFGAIGLQLFRAIGEAPTRRPEDATLYATYTKNPVLVSFKSAEDGLVATYFSRWTSRRGEVGPWSNPVSMRIAA